jgi:hypothetical protein
MRSPTITSWPTNAWSGHLGGVRPGQRRGGFKLTVGLLVFLVAYLTVAPAAPSSAAESERDKVFVPGGETFLFQLPSSRGFRLFVVARGNGILEMTAASRNGVVLYQAQGLVRGNDVAANVGHVGRISVEFTGAGPSRSFNEPGCLGRASRIQAGWFVGRVAFRGEEGFSSALATRVRGWRVRSYPNVCQDGPSEGTDSVSVVEIGSRAPHGNGTVEFAGRAQAEGGQLEAMLVEVRNRVRITRFVRASIPAAALQAGSEDESIVSLNSVPGPFYGSADLKIVDGVLAWRGNLTAAFPGRAVVHLAGARHVGCARTADGNGSKIWRFGDSAGCRFLL